LPVTARLGSSALVGTLPVALEPGAPPVVAVRFGTELHGTAAA